MKEKLIAVFKEIGIALAMIVILCAVAVAVFYNQVPYAKEIPKGTEYAQINVSEYDFTQNRLEGIEAVTVTHEANENQITQAENDVRLTTGKYTPFGTIDGTSDLPSEKIGNAITIPDTSATTSSSSSVLSESAEKFQERIQYPDTSGDSE